MDCDGLVNPLVTTSGEIIPWTNRWINPLQLLGLVTQHLILLLLLFNLYYSNLEDSIGRK